MSEGSSMRLPRSSENLLPPELWTIILDMCLYRPLDFSPSLQLEDVAGLQVNIEEAQEEFKESFYLVCRQFYITAFCIVRRYLVFTCQHDIDTTREEFTRGTGMSSDKVGTWTWRLDLHISDRYTPSSLSTVLRWTPNLKVLVVRNSSLNRTSEGRFRPDIIIHSLGKFCPKLTRLQFESVGEEPSVRLLKDVLLVLPELNTLHIDTGYWPAQGDDDNGESIVRAHTALSTLSIGSVRRRYHSEDGLDRVGVFLSTCVENHVLPNLRVLHMQQAVPLMSAFLERYGPQLLELGFGAGNNAFTAGYHWDDMETYRPHVTTYCPGLRKLVLVTTEWPIFAPVLPLVPHPSVQEVDIVYVKPEGATGGGRGAVALALRVIDGAPLMGLKKITVGTSLGMAAIEAGDSWFKRVRDIRAKGIVIDTIVLTGSRLVQNP